MCTGTVEGCICFAEYKMQPAIQDQEEPPLSVKNKNSALLKILRRKKNVHFLHQVALLWPYFLTGLSGFLRNLQKYGLGSLRKIPAEGNPAIGLGPT